eukprot:TRINITY_DN15291_c0_g1_i1.p1 TRINITY_DN15291_c0_g1~~TRINITY_DN15291_c0_g1_i1.p1  ORF type:complete len:458 (-),score=113.22 TRINITY_DN15291_c0_g1_i1:42-1415(-)
MTEPIFISQEEGEPTVMESLCMQCEEQGTTKLLLMRIPYFRDVVLMAFECDHCGFRNSEVQSTGEIQDLGHTFILKITKPEDLNRQVVQTTTASIRIPEIELEIPRETQGGTMNTIEGVLARMVDTLEMGQPLRRAHDEQVAERVEIFLSRTRELLTGKIPFTFILDDPSGNSFVENPLAPADDPQLEVKRYRRTPAQAEVCGVSFAPETTTADDVRTAGPAMARMTDEFFERVRAEAQTVMQFPTDCLMCHFSGVTNMCVIDIPHFKQTVIMAFVCDGCGYRNNEVKAGGAISPVGKRYELRLLNKEDLSRDVLKSETAELYVPEIELHLTAGTLGGRFTTVEGLMTQISEQLSSANPFVMGDSADTESRQKFRDFSEKLRQLSTGETEFTLIIDDPVGNSYIQPFADDSNTDAQLRVVEYERTAEQDEELGLSDIKTENYEEDGAGEADDDEAQR